MQHKVKQENQKTNKLPAGFHPTDNNIEIIRSGKDRRCIFIQNGHSKPFSELPKDIYKSLEELFLTDHEFVRWATSNYKEDAHDLKRLTEIYASFYYGDCDSKPDIVNGKLQPPENFRESANCPSINFSNTYIDIKGVHLSARDLSIIDNMVNGIPDKLIAHNLGIAHSTFDFHKRNLFKKLNINSKSELIVECFKNKVAV